MRYRLSGKKYNVDIEIKNDKAFFVGGNFGSISLLRSSIIFASLKNILTGEEYYISSENFKTVKAEKYENHIKLYLSQPCGIDNIIFIITGIADDDGISWNVDVINDNTEISVMEATYPMPVLSAEYFDLFEPGACGKVVKNAGKTGYSKKGLYPDHMTCMQYFAVYNKYDGVYLGIEDSKASVKKITILTENNSASLKVDFLGINGTKPHNSFSLYGISRWQFFKGDWYDASMIYADFVYKKAKWLPVINDNGREDTPEKFKNIPFWVTDYIPNSKSQGDNKPMILSAGSDMYYPKYWYNAVIELQKELDVPIAYHVYNWHSIPFNVEYPHFMPAKKEFSEGLEKLKQHNIFVMPYINAVSWETRDCETGHDVNFENTGFHGAVIDKDGKMVFCEYPQKTISGHNVDLAPICPSFEKWHLIIENVSREIENKFDVDGIYFDQISAHSACACYNDSHSHLPGGGSHWVEGYNFMMEKIRMNRPKECFYFSECNAEPYIKSFDGYLTWTWVENGEVPAFPAIYAGYIQMLGRFTIGEKKEDYEFFKYSTAKSLLYGQQIGWCKADILYKPEQLKFLKEIVKIRYKYTKLFNSSKMLRPPAIISDLPPLITSPALCFNEDIVMEQLLSGAWQYRNKEKTVIFLINISENETDFIMKLKKEEYNLENFMLPKEFSVDENNYIIKGKIKPHECKVWEL